MLYESYIQVLLRLISQGKFTIDNIKNVDYKNEVVNRLIVQQTCVTQEELNSTKTIIVKKDDNDALNKAIDNMKIDEVAIYRGEKFCKVGAGLVKVISNHAEYEIIEI